MNVHFKPITLEDIDHFEAKFSNRDGLQPINGSDSQTTMPFVQSTMIELVLTVMKIRSVSFAEKNWWGVLTISKNIGVGNPPVFVGKSR